MARRPRIDIPGLTYHITNRGVKRLSVFHDDDDRQLFLRLLIITRRQFPCVIQNYSLMTNHFHLLIKTFDASLSNLMPMPHVPEWCGAWGALPGLENGPKVR